MSDEKGNESKDSKLDHFFMFISAAFMVIVLSESSRAQCEFKFTDPVRGAVFEATVTDIDEAGNGVAALQVTAPHYSGITYPASGFMLNRGSEKAITAFYLIQEVGGRIDLDMVLSTDTRHGRAHVTVIANGESRIWNYYGTVEGGCQSPPVPVPPALIIQASDAEGIAPLTVEFKAVTDAEQVTWTGLGEPRTGTPIIHIFEDPGEYPVTATAVRNSLTAMASVLIRVKRPAPNQPPSVTVYGTPLKGKKRTIFTFIADAVDPDGSVASYAWDLGDGTTQVGKIVQHSYARPGQYLIACTVEDDQGARSRSVLTAKVKGEHSGN